AGLTHGGGVEDRQQLGEVIDDGSVEQLLVAVEQGHQEEVFVQWGHQPAQVRQYPLLLLFLSEDTWREEPTEPECVPLRLGERLSLVEPRVGQNLHAARGPPVGALSFLHQATALAPPGGRDQVWPTSVM